MHPAVAERAALDLDAVELEQVMAEHIAAVVTHFRGRIYSWDVVNEAMVDVHPGHPRWRSCDSWSCAIKGRAHGMHWASEVEIADKAPVAIDPKRGGNQQRFRERASLCLRGKR